MAKINSGKDLIMLLLYAKGHKGDVCEPIKGKTRLVKMVFLFDKEVRKKFNLNKKIPNNIMPDFEAYDYGPFSVQVYEDLEFLVEIGLVEAVSLGDSEMLDEEIGEYQYWQAKSREEDEDRVNFQEQFRLTDLGIQFVEEELSENLSKEQWEALDEFKHRCTAANLKTLLKYVYTKYPNMTTRSKIYDQILER